MRNKYFLIVIIVLSIFASTNTKAAELVTNGGFETGTFSGWTVINVTNNIWFNWMATTSSNAANSTVWTNGTSPHGGTFDAWNGWAAGNPVPDAYRLRQDIVIPNNANEFIQLKWWDRLQWDLQTFTTSTQSTLPQFRVVNILNPATNVVLREVDRFTAPAFSRGPMSLGPGQGWNQHLANLSAFKGQTIRLEFMCTVAQNTIGPGYCEFDDISVQNFVPTAAIVSVGGRAATADGQAISKAIISISDEGGNTQTAMTNSLGYYFFDHVEAGQTYVISISNKRYQFATPTRVLTVNDALSDVDFTALF